MSSHHLPELGIGLDNHLYPSSYEVIPVRAVNPPFPVAAPKVTPDPQIGILKDQLRVSTDKCAALELALDAKCAECLNYERKLFVLESVAAQAQPMFFPFAGAAAPILHAPARVVEVVAAEPANLFDMEPDMSMVDAFTRALEAEPILRGQDVQSDEEPEEGEEKEDAADVPPPAPAQELKILKTVRRVDMSDLAASVVRWTPEAVLTLATTLSGMAEKEVCKLSVETLTDNLAAFGKMYIKPKMAAAKLLHQIAKARLG